MQHLNSKSIPDKYERLLAMLEDMKRSPDNGYGKIEITVDQKKIVLIRVTSDYKPKFEGIE